MPHVTRAGRARVRGSPIFRNEGQSVYRQGRLSGVWAQVSTSLIILASQRHGDMVHACSLSAPSSAGTQRSLPHRAGAGTMSVLQIGKLRPRDLSLAQGARASIWQAVGIPGSLLGPKRAGGSSGAEDDAPRLPPTLQSAQLPEIPSAASGSSPVCLRCQRLQRGSCHRGTAWGRDQQSSWRHQNRRAENGRGTGGRHGRLDGAAHVGAAPTIAARVGRDSRASSRGWARDPSARAGRARRGPPRHTVVGSFQVTP